MTSSPPARRFDWDNLGVRVVSAVVLVPVALAAIWFGGWAFLLLLSVGIALLSIEWGGMTAAKAPIRIAAVVMISVLAATFASYRGEVWIGWYGVAWASVIVGAALAAFVARNVAEHPINAAYGVIYLAPACIALIWLRSSIGNEKGVSWTFLVFAVAWSADIAAYVVGSTLKGPKLWPRFSPNKTWSGFIGGLIAAMITAWAVTHFSGQTLPMTSALLCGLFGGLATMAGDLWESMLKRRFGVKDSGDLIPGHGGLLDRVDGLLFCIMVVAAARLAAHEGWVF
ncbi:phosphatidate cytidylyltransferase [Caulobacter ginsengisoli]|uniref:Phosphatidate cytidylyltransferase n=1 Tax=Caulobacter ginsengisoli TaxID=400775 RepID=A0ABU0IPY9_9CAUL|nr:phosphatidate cytidylyltransferase [Caulobacter ginsengisoli]MDQ0463022.1 phosphatidate cytidylyltransferase [Caulobacter ginsengisoli]